MSLLLSAPSDLHALEPLLTSDDLQKILRVAERTIHRMAADGRLPAPIKLGGNRWRAEDIRRLLRS